VPVQYYETVQKSREVEVTVVSHETVAKKVKQPVTTYQTVTRTVTEQVPVTRCVPVAPAPAVSSGCVVPTPCGY
jgi:hypothetical protein